MIMDDTTFEYATDDVVAGSRRFPQRPSGHPLRAGFVEAAHLTPSALDTRGDDFAEHAWDESGHL